MPSCLLFLAFWVNLVLCARRRSIAQVHDSPQPSSANCTWLYIEQKLDHFSSSLSATYLERYCIYDAYWKEAGDAAEKPIFFYTGNESPVEEYVNNTGLMWNLGKEMGALLVWAEHRYEGRSLPIMHDLVDCISYCTSAQALEDYVALIGHLKLVYTTNAPVIAFGGSYGGMLAGWFRIKYPDVVAGSIAASAPVAGVPPNLGRAGLDASSAALSRGVSAFGGATDICYSNLRVFWALIAELAKSPYPQTKELLSKAARFCSTVEVSDITNLLSFPWFEMGEGNYPFPSTYITYAVGPGNYPLPAWPMRVACEQGLNKDFGIKIDGKLEDVLYTITMKDLVVKVDWASEEGNGAKLTYQQIVDTGIADLVKAVSDAAGVWNNVTGQVSCYTSQLAKQKEAEAFRKPRAADKVVNTKVQVPSDEEKSCSSCPPCPNCPDCPLCYKKAPTKCTYKDVYPVSVSFCWGPVTCNEDLNLANTYLQGVGRDLFWPPNTPYRNYTLESVCGPRGLQNSDCAPGFNSQGLFGSPILYDYYSEWIVAYYDQYNFSKHSNIVWSNGALDPWSGGGVYPPGGSALGPMVQKISEDGSSIALVIDLGAHHLDLFFPTKGDPPAAIKAREIERERIIGWTSDYYQNLRK